MNKTTEQIILEEQRRYKKEWREKNKDHLKRYYKSYREANKDKLKAYNQNYWLKKANERLGKDNL